MSTPAKKGRGRPRTNRLRVTVKLTKSGSDALTEAAKRAGCAKGELIERLLGFAPRP